MGGRRNVSVRGWRGCDEDMRGRVTENGEERRERESERQRMERYVRE